MTYTYRRPTRPAGCEERGMLCRTKGGGQAWCRFRRGGGGEGVASEEGGVEERSRMDGRTILNATEPSIHTLLQALTYTVAFNPHEVRQTRTVLSQTAHLSTCGGCHPLPGFCKPFPRAHAPAVSGEGKTGAGEGQTEQIHNTNQLWIIMLVGAAVHAGRSQCSSA